MNKKIIILRIIFTILLLSTYSLIFMFSCEDGEKSSKNSKGVMYTIINVIKGNKEVTDQDIENYEPLLRKLAHFAIYTLSGVWSMSLMCTFFRRKDAEKDEMRNKIDNKKNGKTINRNENTSNKNDLIDFKRILFATLIGFLYACSDEIHQLFSSGRSGKIVDIVIDTMGVINGALIVLLICTIFMIMKERSRRSNVTEMKKQFIK